MSAALSMRAAVATFVALLALTGMTVAAAYVDLGAISTTVALAIAAVKAVLVAFCFMQLRPSGRIPWIAMVAGLAWLALLAVSVIADFALRGVPPTG